MKFFLAFTLVVAVASAGVLKKSTDHQIPETIAINSPNTNPVTAQHPGVAQPNVVAPAVVDAVSPISVENAIVDKVSPVGSTIVEEVSPVRGAEDVSAAVIYASPAADGALGGTPNVEITIYVNAGSGNIIQPTGRVSKQGGVAGCPVPVVNQDAGIQLAVGEIEPAPLDKVVGSTIVKEIRPVGGAENVTGEALGGTPNVEITIYVNAGSGNIIQPTRVSKQGEVSGCPVPVVNQVADNPITVSEVEPDALLVSNLQ